MPDNEQPAPKNSKELSPELAKELIDMIETVEKEEAEKSSQSSAEQPD